MRIGCRRLERSNPGLAELRERNRAEGFARMREIGADSPADVIRMLGDRSAPREERIAAALVLELLRCRDATEELIEALDEGELMLSNVCGRALGAIGSRRKSRRLISIVCGRGPAPARREALYALWWLREERAEQLFIRISRAVETEDEFMRGIATEALGGTSQRLRSQRAIRDRLFDPSVSVRYSALCACSLMPRHRVPEFLHEALAAKLADPDKVDDTRVIAELAGELVEAFR